MKETSLWDYMRGKLSGHWVRVESSTENGIPDLNGCMDGIEVWVELKARCLVDGTPGLRPEQVAWHIRRCRHGGRVYTVTRTKGHLHLFRSRLSLIQDRLEDGRGLFSERRGKFPIPMGKPGWERFEEALTE